MNKKTQKIMIWFLPLIVIGGLFFPILGYLVVAMMIFFLTLSFFKERYWCWNLCPRGAFLDIVLAKVSRQKKIPTVFTKLWFRYLILALLMSFLAYRLIYSRNGGLLRIGAVFVSICLLTTIIAIVLGYFMKHRAWCAICPMGTLQEYIGKIHKSPRRKGG